MDLAVIETEIEHLEHRKARLQRLVTLRQEVSLLESQIMTGTEWQCAMRVVAEEVCKSFQVSFEKLIDRTRVEPIATARHVVFYIGRTIRIGPKQISLANIGGLFGRDHGTVLHGCRHVMDLQATDREFAARVQGLTASCVEKLFRKSPHESS